MFTVGYRPETQNQRNQIQCYEKGESSRQASTPSLKGPGRGCRAPLPGLSPSSFSCPLFCPLLGPTTPPGPLPLPQDNAALGHEACSCDEGTRPLELFKLMGSHDT